MEIAIYIVVGGLFLAATMYQRVQTEEQWQSAAEELGLELQSGLLTSPALTGRYKGASVEVATVTRGSKHNRQTYTTYDLGLPPNAPPNLVIAKEGFFAGLGKFVGMQDIEVGDEIFDSEFIVKGKDPAAVKAFLSQDRVADEIFEVYGSYPNNFEIKDGRIRFEGMDRASGYQIKIALDTAAACLNAMRGNPPMESESEPESARSGPFGGIPDHVKNNQGPSQPSAPPPSAANGKFGPPTQTSDPGAASGSDASPDASQQPSDNQQDDWW